MVPFGGWEMPLSYPLGTVNEHIACRTNAVVFDVSHLGTVRLSGADALSKLQYCFTNDLTKIAPGRAQYTHHLDPQGSVVDDIIVWWIDDQNFDIMPNASNVAPVLASTGGTDVTDSRTILAIQGPNARTLISNIFTSASQVRRFTTERLSFRGYDVVVAGTGYTGEDGIEISVPNEGAAELFDAILSTGISPAGLGARDTLRLEAGLVLHGHELGQGITPYQANLGWVVSMTKGDFIGKAALEIELATGVSRRLMGIKGSTRVPMRAEMDVLVDEKSIGHTTSGNYSPSLGVGIALALVEPSTKLGTRVQLSSGGRKVEGAICELPFVEKYKR